MANISFTIPDAQLARIVNNISQHFNYEAEVTNPAFDPGQPEDPTTNPATIPNPESKAQFVKRMVKETMIAWVKAEEKRPVIQTANSDFEDAFIDPTIG